MIAPDIAPPPPSRGVRRRAWVLLALVAVGAVGVLAYSWRSSRKSAEAARRAVEAREFDRARPLVEAWLARDPNSGEAHYLLARIELAADHGQAAMNELGKALDDGYPAEELAPYRAVIQAQTAASAEAEPILRRALAESSAPMPEVAAALARIYLSTFRLPLAVEPIARWMRDAPDDPRPYLWQNEIEMRRDADHAVVIQNYREALRRDPDNAKARLGLANRLLQAHRLDEASEEFAAFLRIKPEDPEGLLGSGRVALEQGRLPEAVRFFEATLKRNPRDPIALKELGTIALRRSESKKARDLLLKATEVDPYDPELHFNLARALQRLGDEEGTKREDALSQKLRAEHKRLADVRSFLVKRPTDLALRVEVMRWMLDHGRPEEGLNWADQILHDHPGHEETIRALIDYFTRVKDAGKANYYRMLLKTGPGQAPRTK